MARIQLDGGEPDYREGAYYGQQIRRLSNIKIMEKIAKKLGCHIEVVSGRFQINVVKRSTIIFRSQSHQKVLVWLGIEACRRMIDRPRPIRKSPKRKKASQ